MIEVSGLTKRYGATTAVDDLTFEVRPGRVTGFLGPNGAGKTTTMRAILGLDTADSGAARVNGRLYRAMNHPLHQVGALLDANAVHGGRSAQAHLTALAVASKISRGRVQEVLETVGLGEVGRKRVGGFSLGMKQRLGIAGALLGDAPILMFDEPANGLDPEGIRWIRTFLKSLAAEGRTVFVSSHLMSETALTADHLIVIGRGRLIADAGVEEFVRGHSASRVAVETPARTRLGEILRGNGAVVEYEGTETLLVGGLTVGRIGDLAAGAGLSVHGLAVREASLEDVFMEMTRDVVEYEGVDRGD